MRVSVQIRDRHPAAGDAAAGSPCVFHRAGGCPHRRQFPAAPELTNGGFKPARSVSQNKDHPRETLRKEVVFLFAFVSRQNDWFAEKSFYDIIIFR